MFRFLVLASGVLRNRKKRTGMEGWREGGKVEKGGREREREREKEIIRRGREGETET